MKRAKSLILAGITGFCLLGTVLACDVTKPAAKPMASAEAECSSTQILQGYIPLAAAQEPQPLLASVPLSAATQRDIYELCGCQKELFCAVMAIANVESGFIENIIGDNGQSVGMMQINYSQHRDRLTKLGLESAGDLMDPVNCAAVAVDYIKELEKTLYTSPDSHVLYVGYNAGIRGARELFKQNIWSTSYSWSCIEAFEDYLAEMTGI